MLKDNYFLLAARDELAAFKELLLENKLIFTFLLLGFLAGLYLIDPIAGSQIRMAISGEESGYSLIAQKQAQFLKDKGISLSTQNSPSSMQSAQMLASGTDGVNAALIQGGVLSSELADKLQSLGSVDFEPVWIFQRKGLANRTDRLKDLARLRVGVGPSQSGTWTIAKKIFLLNGIDIESAQNFKVGSYESNLADLLAGELDVVINVNPAIDPIVMRLLHEPEIELFELTHAAAYDIQLPFVKVVTLPAAAIDIARQIPPKDISLLATTTNLAVSKDLHPGLQMVLLMAAKEAQRSSRSLFLSSEEKFPAYLDLTIPISATASSYYDYGVPQTMRYLPFWLAAFIDRIWVYILSVLAIIIPLSQLNINLRAIRFRIRIEKILREVLQYERDIAQAPLTAERRLAITKRLGEIRKAEVQYRVPSGCESDYLDFLERLSETRSQLD